MKTAHLFKKGSILLSPLFLLMFAIACLLNINFTILRSMRSALTVADLGGSASLIPYFELIGTLPGSLLITWFITFLLSRLPIQKVFFITMGVFLSFFAIFALIIYPALPAVKLSLLSMDWLPGHVFMSQWAATSASMLFYTGAELWKVALFAILFWGLVNQYLKYDEAKQYYGPLTLGNSIGAIIAGPLISFCTYEKMSWGYSLNLLVGVICIIGVLSAILYHYLWKLLAAKNDPALNCIPSKESMSIKESLSVCWSSPYLMLLAFIVFADYVCYSLGELVLLDLLKISYPDPNVYCHYMGKLAFWSGLLTTVSALFITPWVLERYRWVVASLVTPFCLLFTQIGFILVVCSKDLWPTAPIITWINVAVFLGSLQYILCRGAKSTFFDSSKDLAFVHLPATEKMQGKLIIDGICARFGRGGASIMSILLIRTLGSPLSSAWLAGIISSAVIIGWIKATLDLGPMVDGKKQKKLFNNKYLGRST